jgi:predicted PurR-regulated permease PerM
MMQAQALVRWTSLAAVTVAAFYVCWLMLSPFIDVLVWAVVLVIVFYPAHRRIVRRVRHPALSALASVLLIMLVVIVPLSLISSAVVVQLAAMRQGVQDQVQSLLAGPSGNAPIDRLIESINRYVNLRDLVSADAIRQLLSRASELALRGTLSVVGGIVQFIVSVFFILFTMFYLFRDGETITERMPEALPLNRTQAEAIMTRTTEMIHASVNGIVVIAILQGTLGGLMFWILAVPSALVLGVLMTVLSTIPMLGSYIVWVPAAIWLAVSGHWIKALILVGFGMLVIGMVDNLLRPALVGRKTRMHDLVIFFSLLGGIKLFGFLGILLGPVVVSLALALFQIMLEGIVNGDGTAVKPRE